MHRLFAATLAGLVIATATLATGCVSVKSEEHHVEVNKMSHLGKLRHVVMFRFKEDADPAQIRRVEEAFAALPSKIPQIRGFEWGTNNSPEGLDMGYTHIYLLTFDSAEDRAAYLPHPAHQAFGRLLGPILDEVHVLDYYAQR